MRISDSQPTHFSVAELSVSRPPASPAAPLERTMPPKKRPGSATKGYQGAGAIKKKRPSKLGARVSKVVEPAENLLGSIVSLEQGEGVVKLLVYAEGKKKGLATHCVVVFPLRTEVHVSVAVAFEGRIQSADDSPLRDFLLAIKGPAAVRPCPLPPARRLCRWPSSAGASASWRPTALLTHPLPALSLQLAVPPAVPASQRTARARRRCCCYWAVARGGCCCCCCCCSRWHSQSAGGDLSTRWRLASGRALAESIL